MLNNIKLRLKNFINNKYYQKNGAYLYFLYNNLYNNNNNDIYWITSS